MRGRGSLRSILVVGALAVSAMVIAPIRAERAGAGSDFVPLPAPRRLLDTRPGAATVDGQFAGIGLRPAQSTLRLDVAGRAGIPADATTVLLNVTAVDARGWGFLTVHPSDSGRPNASNLNYTAGDTIANCVIARVGAGGDISVYTYAATHLIVDVTGHLPVDGFSPLPSPRRLADTRPGTTTIDGQFAGIGVRPAASSLQLSVAGRAGIPADAAVVVLNVTAAVPDNHGFLTVHPTGSPRPNASNLNYAPGQTVANTVITKLGPDGSIAIYTYAGSHLIVDVAGHLAADSFIPLPAPKRLTDTRRGAATIDGRYAGIGPRRADSTAQLKIAGRGDIPTNASSVVLNIAAVDPQGWGFVTVYPTGAGRPNASNVNYNTGENIANTVVTRLGAGGDVCIYTYGVTHLIVDVAGYLPGPPPPPPGPTCDGVSSIWVPITDDSASIGLYVPSDWTDINGAGWDSDLVVGDDLIGPALSAAPDLDAFYNTWDAEGVFIGASTQIAMSADEVLDEIWFGGECIHGGRWDKLFGADNAFSGTYDFYFMCGGTHNEFQQLAGRSADGNTLVLLQLQNSGGYIDTTFEIDDLSRWNQTH